MTIKIEHEGQEIEVYTAAEMTAREAEARTAVENEYKPKLSAEQAEKARLEGLLTSRAEEFKGFRKLSDEAVAKLGEAERIIYENGVALAEANEKVAAGEKEKRANAITASIKAKVGNNEALATKVKDMYQLVGLDDSTPEGVEKRVLAALGALGQVEPDIVAQIQGFQGGSYVPPVTVKADEGFGATERGKAGAAELGLVIEPPKK